MLPREALQLAHHTYPSFTNRYVPIFQYLTPNTIHSHVPIIPPALRNQSSIPITPASPIPSLPHSFITSFPHAFSSIRIQAYPSVSSAFNPHSAFRSPSIMVKGCFPGWIRLRVCGSRNSAPVFFMMCPLLFLFVVLSI